MNIETVAIHAGNHTDPATKAVVQPITLSTTFERGEDGEFPAGFIYTRAANPNRKSLENVLAQLEGGEDCCAFSSGNAAGSAVLQALPAGSHIIAPDDMYHGLRSLINTVFEGVLTVDYLDYSDLAAIEKTIKPNTKLIWIETPSNPLLKITDIAAVCKLAQSRSILVCCDNTFATPVFQRPLDLGADLVMHATTKYLGGHSDVLGGALIAKSKNDFWTKVRNIQTLSGAVPSPFDCYMTVRGIKTLPYRMRGHAANAKQIADYLNAHPIVEKVFYPGLESHTLYNVAKSQMKDFGGMLSFTVNGSSDDTRRISNKLKLFTRATSLGGVESLIEHRASMEGPDTKTPPNLLRISVGLEFIDVLIADLEQALK